MNKEDIEVMKFANFEVVDTEQRFFKAIATVETIDLQGEIAKVDDLEKYLPSFMDRNPSLLLEHSNKVIGKILNCTTTEIDGKKAIVIDAKIHKNTKLENKVWEELKSDVYKGLSIGGEAERDGNVLKNIRLFEISLVKSPANQDAKILAVNTIAKSENIEKRCEKCGQIVKYINENQEDNINTNLNEVNNMKKAEEEEKPKEEVKEKVEEEKPKEEKPKEEPMEEKPVEPPKEETEKEEDPKPNTDLAEIKAMLSKVIELLAPKPDNLEEINTSKSNEVKKSEKVIVAKTPEPVEITNPEDVKKSIDFSKATKDEILNFYKK